MNAQVEQFLQRCDEKQLFATIYEMGGGIWSIKHDLADDRYELTPNLELWLIESQEVIEFAVDQTARFGVTQPRHAPDKGGTEEYWDWYKGHKTWWCELKRGERLDYLSELQEMSREPEN